MVDLQSFLEDEVIPNLRRNFSKEGEDDGDPFTLALMMKRFLWKGPNATVYYISLIFDQIFLGC